KDDVHVNPRGPFALVGLLELPGKAPAHAPHLRYHRRDPSPLYAVLLGPPALAINWRGLIQRRNQILCDSRGTLECASPLEIRAILQLSQTIVDEHHLIVQQQISRRPR